MQQQDEFGRGVWKARYRKDGHEILLAVDSKLDCIKGVVLRPGIDEDRAMRYLERLLDERDPVPQLRLVKDPPARSWRMGPTAMAGLMRAVSRSSASSLRR